MKFLVGDTVDFQGDEKELESVEITTLKELLAFVLDAKDSVIIHSPRDGCWDWELEIYNGPRE